jgi:ATP/maltotriose-dependent transcriptional regulator MalT
VAGPAPPEEITVTRLPAQPGEPLTKREQQILEFISQGWRNSMIGRQLFLSEDTVKTHARRLYAKLGARDRSHAVRRGFELGLLRSPDRVEISVGELEALKARWLAEVRYGSG